MLVFCDDTAYAGKLLPRIPEWHPLDKLHADADNSIRIILFKLFNEKPIFYHNDESCSFWNYCFISGFAEASQFDKLLELSRSGLLSNMHCLAVAAEGSGFHGFRNRDWVTAPGNLHLSVYLSPQTAIKFFHVAFTILLANAALQALDEIASLKGKSQIRWINDIVINDAKAGGVLTHTQTQGNIVTSAILGIGINIECTPSLKPDIFVPGVTAIKKHCNDIYTQSTVLHHLLEKIQINYTALIRGHYNSIFSFYKSRSMVIGRHIAVYSDPLQGNIQKLSEGKVVDIGKGLELYLEGQRKPINRGRIVLKK